MVEAGNLASVFQLTAGISLAINVFRAPHEQQYQRLGSALDAEETLLAGRSGVAVDQKAARVAELRTEWIVVGNDLADAMVSWEKVIWAGVTISTLLLLFCSLWADWSLAFWWATTLVIIGIAPIIVGVTMMWRMTTEKLRSLRGSIRQL